MLEDNDIDLTVQRGTLTSVHAVSLLSEISKIRTSSAVLESTHLRLHLSGICTHDVRQVYYA